MRIDQALGFIGYMNSEPDGIPIVIGAKRINPLAINLARVVIEVLLYVEHVVTESRQIYGANTW